VYVHVLDIGQVAHDTGHDDIALVFDCAGLAAIAHAQVSAALVRAERYEEEECALIDEVTGLFREFAIIADHHTDRAAIGLDHGVAFAALNIPPAPLGRRGVKLLLCVNRPVAQEDI